jgi:predicted methyltransferase
MIAAAMAACFAPVCLSHVLAADAAKPAAAAPVTKGSGDPNDKSYNPDPIFQQTYVPGKDVSPAIKAALDDPMRPVWERARDAQKKPGEVLAIAGIKPGDRIVNLVPGDGYYTRILSPLVGAKGKVYTLVPLRAGMRDGEMVRQLEAEAIAAGKKPIPNPVDGALAIQNISHYSNVTVLWEMLYQYNGQFGVPEQLDAVFTADAYHDIEGGPYGKMDIVAVNKAIFQSMKPGGTFTVIDYSAPKDSGTGAAAVLHRSDKEQVKKGITAAGFTFDGENPVLAIANQDATRPAMDGKAGDGIDQYVLRFKKPANASNETLRPKADPFAGYYGNTEIGNYLSKGTVSGNRPRYDLYNADGTYEEMGMTNPLQEGIQYWDAAGHNCEIHQFPATQRNFIVCHVIDGHHKVGDIWGEGVLPDGTPRRSILLKGHVFPPVPTDAAINTPY